MKVEVRYTFEATDHIRRAIAYFGLREGLATREEIKSWLQQNGTESLEDLLSHYDVSYPSKEHE